MGPHRSGSKTRVLISRNKKIFHSRGREKDVFREAGIECRASHSGGGGSSSSTGRGSRGRTFTGPTAAAAAAVTRPALDASLAEHVLFSSPRVKYLFVSRYSTLGEEKRTC